jgi:hypothetical protein
MMVGGRADFVHVIFSDIAYFIETSAKSEVVTVCIYRKGETAEHGDDLDHDTTTPSLRSALVPLTA